MSDRILAERLEALEAALAEVKDASAWPRRFDRLSRSRRMLNPDIWLPVAVEINGRAVTLGKELQAIRRTLETATGPHGIAEAWHAYVRVSQASEELFRERLDVLGGLAFRNNELDEKICQLADELIHSTVKRAGIQPSLSVPGAVQARTKTLARVIRLRFPEWTIWTLPFTAHEYGRVVADHFPALKEVLAQRSGGGPDGELAVGVLVADAFATFTVGPAYALAAVHMRLNPVAAPASGHPPDAERAAVVFAALEAMNADERERRRSRRGSGPYAALAQELRGEWQALAERLGTAAADVDEQLVQELRDGVFGDQALEAVRYPYGQEAQWPAEGTHGWKVALAWSEHWLDELGRNQELTSPPVSSGSTVRDALNAAWRARLAATGETKHAADIEAIGAAALRLCEEIGEPPGRPAEAAGDVPRTAEEVDKLHDTRKGEVQRAAGSQRTWRGPS